MILSDVDMKAKQRLLHEKGAGRGLRPGLRMKLPRGLPVAGRGGVKGDRRHGKHNEHERGLAPGEIIEALGFSSRSKQDMKENSKTSREVIHLGH